MDEIKARCSQCKRFVHIEFPSSYKDFSESLDEVKSGKYLTEAGLAWAEDPECATDRFGYIPGVVEDGSLSYYLVVVIHTPYVRIVPVVERNKKPKPYLTRPIPSLRGAQSLLVNAPEKERFLRALGEASLFHVQLGLTQGSFPDWFPDWRADASPEDFAAWAEQLEQEIDHRLKQLDLLPDW